MDSTNGAYQTSDTSLATYLITEGFSLSNIDYSQPRFVYSFDGDIEILKSFEHKYIAGKASVDPSIYSRVNRKLMRAIKNELQWWRA